MKYYAVVELALKDDAWMAEYIPNVTRLVEKYGGRYFARTTNLKKIEGERPLPDAMVILEFPSRDAAQTFYDDPEYKPYLEMRLAGADCEFTLVAGEDIGAQ